LQDLKDFCDIFDRESRPFDRLLFVLRLLNLQNNPLASHSGQEQAESGRDVLEKFYQRERKTIILI